MRRNSTDAKIGKYEVINSCDSSFIVRLVNKKVNGMLVLKSDSTFVSLRGIDTLKNYFADLSVSAQIIWAQVFYDTSVQSPIRTFYFSDLKIDIFKNDKSFVRYEDLKKCNNSGKVNFGSSEFQIELKIYDNYDKKVFEGRFYNKPILIDKSVFHGSSSYKFAITFNGGHTEYRYLDIQ